MTAIRIEDLHKKFGSVEALRGLTLNVPEGKVFGFLGANGAGKTTTIRILTGLSAPTSGTAWIHEVEAKPSIELAKLIGYLPEEPVFYNWMTPKEFLDHTGRLFGLKSSERKSRTKELLEKVGLEKAGKRRIGGFSRGMRQRLGLAQAMLNRPRVLFLDEPVSALDPVGRKEILEMIENLRGECTVFMSTHILGDVERVCDSIGIIDQGRLLVESTHDDLIRRYTTPTIELEFEQASENELMKWTAQISKMGWVTDAKMSGLSLRLLVTDTQAAREQLMRMIPQSKLLIRRMELVTPSLEDVFMKVIKEKGGGA